MTVSKGDSLSIRVALGDAQILPDFVKERLRRGIPATVGFQVELWRDRSVWFDSRRGSVIEEFKLTRDSWFGTYSLHGSGEPQTADSLARIETLLASHPIEFPIKPEWCDSSSSHWVVVTVVVIPLTAKDLGEVEDWLLGELGGKSGGLLGVPRGLFGVVRDLSGLGDRKQTGESVRFLLDWDREGGVSVVETVVAPAAN